MKPLKSLNERHIAFIEYLIQCNGNQREAAERAGYSKATARSIGSALYADPLIFAEYQARLVDVKQAAGITTEAVIAELAAIAFANVDDYTAWSGGGTVPNPLYVSASEKAELEREVSMHELLGQEVPKKVQMLLDAANNPLINTSSPTLDVPHRLSLVESDKLTRQQKAGIGEVTFKPTKFGAVVSIKMASKLDALGKLVNALGINAPKKIDLSTTVNNTTFGIKRRAPTEAPPAAPVSDLDTGNQ